MQPKLSRVFRKGIFKAARSTDAWIITSGVNTGVVPYVATALEGSSVKSRSRVIAIGIAPWGMLKKRNRFIGTDISVHYVSNQFIKSRLFELNDRHSYFIFADNGTVGRSGSELILRKRLEAYFAQQISSSIPVVCIVLEGGALTVKVVHDYITNIPRIPVVVCDGSGGAADLLAFTHRAINDERKPSESARNQLVLLVKMAFNYDDDNANKAVQQLIQCSQRGSLMTIFRMGEEQQEMDHAILTALLKGKNLSTLEQLQLTLAWNRADIARTEIFTLGSMKWNTDDLHNAMMEALILDRTEFVQLLLENGVSMHRFLTYGRLEHLYNSDKGPPNTLLSKMGTTSKKRNRINLIDKWNTEDLHNAMMEALILDRTEFVQLLLENGVSMHRFLTYGRLEHLYNSDKGPPNTLLSKMGTTSKKRNRINLIDHSSPRSNYGWTQSEHSKEDKKEEHSTPIDLLHTARNSIFSIFVSKQRSDEDDGKKLLHLLDEAYDSVDESLDFTFKYPYSELLIWAILTKRHSMALLMWKHGKEAMAKSLVACHLYDSLANDASQNYLELEVCEELRKNSEEFRKLSIEVLQYCSEQDKDITLQLLTYELTNWGNETCLSLAALNKNRQFLAHPCCQLLLSDLWQGGLHLRNNANMKNMRNSETKALEEKDNEILGSLIIPIGIFMMEYKTKEELMLQPHTFAEHLEENSDSDTSLASTTSYSDSCSTHCDEVCNQEEISRRRGYSDNREPMHLNPQEV
ncbi:hypothetical protein DICVIV_03977 [Dictyocaulus viviparus]|uniref:Uncharacterized protein n=1 Tax=Dictyocaulus viviparus TaxID=29172 RepID=A0A0D8Y5M8_DICVI|nr:hypothetical protein DICVIV_03977 [Dictyocaulus viviparus]